MNKSYKVIWNPALKVFQVCSELINSHSASVVANTSNSPRSSHHRAGFRLTLMSLALLLSQSTTVLAATIDNGQSVTITSTDGLVNDSFIVGVNGAGTLNIINGGKVNTSSLSYNRIGSNTSGTGTVLIDGASSSWNLSDLAYLLVGNFGKGEIIVQNGGALTYSPNNLVLYVGSQPGSSGVITVDSGGQLNVRNLVIGDGGTGILNLKNNSTMTSIYESNVSSVLLVGTYAGSSGTVNVDSGARLILRPENAAQSSMSIGFSGKGTMTLSNGGTLVTGTSAYDIGIAVNSGSTGTLNIGAEAGSTASAPGFVTGKSRFVFGQGDGRVVFNHTDTSAAGYTFSPLISGTGVVDHYQGHTLLTAANTYTGQTSVYGGTLTLDNSGGTTGPGTILIDNSGTFELNKATTDGNGNYLFRNSLTGGGLLTADLASADNNFSFDPLAGTAFKGVVALKQGAFSLSGNNTAAIANAVLQTDKGNSVTVGNGSQSFDGLAFNGGTVIFDATLPADTVSANMAVVNTLVAGATSYVKNGRTYQVDGSGNVRINIPSQWDDPGVPAPGTSLSLLEQDDADIGVQLVKATTTLGSAGELTLSDQNGDAITSDKTVQIAQNGTAVADGLYGFRLTTAPGDGLYVNYGLKQLNLLAGKTLVFTENTGATGSAADMSAKITGSGNLAIESAGLVSLSNGLNDYSGVTSVKSGTLRADANGALGNTSELNISSNAITDLNGTSQTIGSLQGQAGSSLNLNGGELTLLNGGLSEGSLTGSGALNIDGGLLDIHGANSALSAVTSVKSNAEVILNNAAGAGTGSINNAGTLTLDGVTGTFANSLSGSGTVGAENSADVIITGDNSAFSGVFALESGSAATVNKQQNLGTASVANEGQLTVDTADSWVLNNTISGSGSLIKMGSGTVTMSAASAGYTGVTYIQGGELAFENQNVNMATSLVNIHDGAVLSGPGSVAGDVNVMTGGTLRSGNTRVGGSLNNSGTILLNQPGSQPGNQLTVNGNYTGNNGLMVFNTALNDDSSATDKMIVRGDTSGNTRVTVNNLGGVGGYTINGIQLIQVDGNSAGTFTQTGRIVAGAYDYALVRGNGDNAQNWYLTNEQPVTPVNPVTPVTPHAGLRPEGGSYISNLVAANSFFTHRLHDRLGEPQFTDSLKDEGSVSSMWMRHIGGHESSSEGSGTTKTQANRYILQIGGDLAQWSADGVDRWHLGAMGGYANQHSHTRSNQSGYGSEGQINGYSVGLYGTWYQNDEDKQGLYVDSWALYNWFDNQVKGDGLSAEKYKSKGVTASVESGYTFKLGEFYGSQGSLNTWYIQPQAQITWMGVKDDKHREANGTDVSTSGEDNLQTRLGVKTYLNSFNKRDAGKHREFQPFVEANWIHNTKSYDVTLGKQQLSRDGYRNLGEVRTGVEGKLNDNLSVWGTVGVRLGDAGYNDTQGMLGMKYGF